MWSERQISEAMAMHALNYALTHILTQNVAMQTAFYYALKIFALTHNLTQRKSVAMQIALNYALRRKIASNRVQNILKLLRCTFALIVISRLFWLLLMK